MVRRSLARLVVALLTTVAAASARSAVAAEAGGSLRGQVTDPSGAGVGSAQVEVSGAGAKRVARTDARGGWSVTGLRAGSYLLVVSRAGFTPFAQSGVSVAEGQETTVDAKLELAPVEGDGERHREHRRPSGSPRTRPRARS